MKKIILILLLTMSSSVFAEAAFDGVNTQIGVGFANLGSENNWPEYGPGYEYKYGEKGIIGNFSLGYSHKLDNQFNIAANAFYTFGSNKSGGRPDDDNTIYKTNDIWGVVLEPGYYFSENTLGFLKLGYARASSEFIDTLSSSRYGNSNGFLYGLGFKQSLQSHFYFGAETYRINFSKSDTVYNADYGNTNNTPSITYGGIMLGYNFGSDNIYVSNTIHNPGAFNGINAQFVTGFAEKSSRSDWPDGGESDRYDVSDKGGLSNLSIGYSHNLNGQYNIAANIFYTFGNNDAGQWRSENKAWRIKDIWGIALEPGYYFNDSGLGYLKIGYARGSSEYQSTGGNAYYGSTGGFLYGVGFKQLLTNNIYVGLETYQINFAKSRDVISEADYTTSNKPSLTYGGVMIGCKF